MGYRTILSLIIFLLGNTASAELILSAPPRENSAEAQKLYSPLADELGKITGEKVVFSAPESWAAYSRHIQEGKYDFVFDGPHFVAWRMVHTEHVPLVRVDGKLGYTVFSAKDGPASLNDLRFKNVCSMASPNLAAVVLLAQFDPYAAPTLVAPRGGVKGSFTAFEEKQCVAVALPSYFTERLPPEKVAGLKKLFVSPEMPNLTLTAGPRVRAQDHRAIIKGLTGETTQANLKKLLDSLAGTGAGVLVPAKSADYTGHEKLLEGVVWGW